MTVGTVVQLKSGGPDMVIVYRYPNSEIVKCQWHDDLGEIQTHEFNTLVLALAHEAPAA